MRAEQVCDTIAFSRYPAIAVLYDKLMQCYESVRKQTDFKPKTALVLGSGHAVALMLITGQIASFVPSPLVGENMDELWAGNLFTVYRTGYGTPQEVAIASLLGGGCCGTHIPGSCFTNY